MKAVVKIYYLLKKPAEVAFLKKALYEAPLPPAHYELCDLKDETGLSDNFLQDGPLIVSQSLFNGHPLVEKIKGRHHLILIFCHSEDSPENLGTDYWANVFFDLSHEFAIVPLMRAIDYARHFGVEARPKEVSTKIDSILKMTTGELERVGNIHQSIVPFRQSKFQNLLVASKFAAGAGPGGEFFDFLQIGQEVLAICSSSPSYIASSIVLSHFEKWRERLPGGVNRELTEDFFEELIDECRGLKLIDRNYPENLEISFFVINLNSLKLKGHHFGRGRIYSNYRRPVGPNSLAFHENNFDQTYFEFQLKRDEEVLLCSSGTMRNLYGVMQRQQADEWPEQIFGGDVRDILNEVFFKIKAGHESEFLSYDSSVLYFKVDSHSIVSLK